ncbi:pleckstrin homology domain-containing family G member 3-like, partial [Pollicipes pollicipes]|uniref:pleckstrin homology domain-containing family G member 3-like n=1 Tax=Pollicipes pollicipes TaxID=41117 RepID=UPI0018857EDF
GQRGPLSCVSSSSSASSGAGSLPRPPLRRRQRRDSDDASPGAGGHSSDLSSSSTLSVGASSPFHFDVGLSPACRVVAEIVHTEAVYVSDLREVIEGYLLYWRENPKPFITEEHTELLFGDYQVIYRCNREFLCALEPCGLDPLMVAECFVSHQGQFAVYTDYCTNYPRHHLTLSGTATTGCWPCLSRSWAYPAFNFPRRQEDTTARPVILTPTPREHWERERNMMMFVCDHVFVLIAFHAV